MNPPLAVLTAAVLLSSIHPSSAAAADPSAVTVHRYATTERGFSANAWWLESKDGLVLIDALFLKPDAENLAALLKSRRKPLLGIFLTHPHVDHFGGLGTLRRAFPKVPILATQPTAEAVEGVHRRAFEQGWIQAYGADYEAEVTLPDRVVESGRQIALGHLLFTVTTLGAMEAADNSVVYSHQARALFTGDAVLNGPMYYLGEGHAAGALAGFDQLATLYGPDTVVHAGHGESGRLGPMLAHDREQVTYMRTAVAAAFARPRALTPDGQLTDPARARLLGLFSERFRNYYTYGVGVDTLTLMNLGGLEPEIAAARAADPEAASRSPQQPE